MMRRATEIKIIEETITRYTINTAFEKGLIKVGLKVRTNGNDGDTFSGDHIEGVIGEIQNNSFYVFNNEHDGTSGYISPKSLGFKYAWTISKMNTKGWIEILGDITEPKIAMEEMRYLVLSLKGSTLGSAKDKRQLMTVLKKVEVPHKIYEVKEVKTKLRLEEI